MSKVSQAEFIDFTLPFRNVPTENGFVLQQMTKIEYCRHIIQHYGPYGENCSNCNGPNEPFMIKNDLWAKVSEFKRHDDCICLRCCEAILKRPLELDDFTDAIINDGIFGFNKHSYVRLK